MSEYKLPFTGEEIEEKLRTSVSYEEQSLSEEQKKQVRENIGAVSIDDIFTILPNANGVSF